MLSSSSFITFLVWLLSLVQAFPQPAAPLSQPAAHIQDHNNLFKRQYLSCFNTQPPNHVAPSSSNVGWVYVSRAIRDRNELEYQINNQVDFKVDASQLTEENRQVTITVKNFETNPILIVFARRRTSWFRPAIIEEYDRFFVPRRVGAIAGEVTTCVHMRKISGEWYVAKEE